MTIRDVCLTFSDGDWIESKDQSDCGIRLIQTGNIGNGEYLDKPDRAKYISEETYSRLNCTEIFPGDILVSRLPDPIGRACIIPESSERMITAVDCTICRPDEDIILKEYLCYYMQSTAYYSRLMNSVTGTTRKRISRSNLGSVEVPVPDKSTQKNVVEKLDRLKTIIRARKEELEKLDNLIKARFVEMFGDPASNPYGFLRLSVREAVENGYIGKPLDGNHGNKHPKASEYVDDGIPFVMANDLVDGQVNFDKCAKITRERADKLDKGFAHDGDVLITHKGTIGRTAILHTDLDYVMLTPQVTYYRPLKGVLSEYLKGYFDSYYFQGEMKRLAAAGGSTRDYVGITNQTQLPLLIPDLDRQSNYIEFVKRVDKSKSAVQKSLCEAQLLFDSLMQQYFG